MELRQLAYFVAVAEEGTFTAAAARVHVAQPGVSAQIRQLERELGQELFDRTGRTVRLTEVGEAVLPYARAALEAVDGARHTVEELTGLLRGHVSVGMVTACSSVDLFEMLETFHQRHQAVEIALSEADSDLLVAGIQSGQLDLALVGLAGEPPAGVASQVLVDEALVAAVPPNDSLAGTVGVTLVGLSERALICLPRGTGVRAALDEACLGAGIQPRIAFEASDPTVVAQLATRELGVAILPESVAAAFSDTLRTIAIVEPTPRSRLELAWRADGPISPAARALIELARQMLPAPSALEPDDSGQTDTHADQAVTRGA
jgi:DNA-binding transcriptional LysR family regulator